ncbi:MAG: prolipoprotein diacylglyceryl transferase [Ilumatobacteraceae bacterium]
MMLASIPSPSFNSLDIGPFSLNLYGLMIALGVVAAVWLFGRRLEEREVGTRDDASAIAVWAVLAGVIGARLYHVATDWERFENDLGKIPAIWQGGLGIPGGLLLGVPVGLYLAHKRSIPIAVAATCAAPAIPLAQAIGRWGNYFNQELYGGPTDLPWGLEIDAAHMDTSLYAVGTTFHPTFLYESLWSLGLCLLLLWIDKRIRPAPGQLFVMYVIGYGVGRFWVEGMRIDDADHLGGLRWNQWVALGAVVLGVIVLLWMRKHPIAEPEPAMAVSTDGVETADDRDGPHESETLDDLADAEGAAELRAIDGTDAAGADLSDDD